jgi:carbamoyltransferase
VTYVLGISCYYHDAAAALLKDGILVAAAEEERFTRRKHDTRFPESAIAFCLRLAGIKASDLDYVVFYEKPFLKFERILYTAFATFPRSQRFFRESMISWLNEKLFVKAHISRKLRLPADRILFCEHHVSHAASAFFASPFEEAAIVTADGVGEWTTATIGQGRASWKPSGVNSLDLSLELRFPHSLGLLYSAFTAFLGFEVNEGEYKVMGMAPYGEARYVDQVHKVMQLAEDGSIHLDMDYFSYHYSTEQSFTKKFVELFGPPRRPESPFFTHKTHPERDGAEAQANQRYADVAASIQLVAEEALLKMARHAHRLTGSRRLCMAGGVALNSVANGRILRETPFEELYIQPAAGDSGGALGAALYAYHVLLGQPRRYVMEHAYYGEEYADGQIVAALDAVGLRHEVVADEQTLTGRVVDALTAGKAVGWFQGRFEWGPRALGNRSILADPRRAEMKEVVNAKIKFREPFRPFAPVVLEEETQKYFVLKSPERQFPARFMLLVTPVEQAKQDVIPAVNHFGTARVQTIRKEMNPPYYELVRQFGQETGVPVLMNTSFNLRGEPIVATPGDAINTFQKSGLDMLVMGHFLVEKDR